MGRGGKAALRKSHQLPDRQQPVPVQGRQAAIPRRRTHEAPQRLIAATASAPTAAIATRIEEAQMQPGIPFVAFDSLLEARAFWGRPLLKTRESGPPEGRPSQDGGFGSSGKSGESGPPEGRPEKVPHCGGIWAA